MWRGRKEGSRVVGCGRDDFSTLDAILSLGTAEKARVVRDSLHEANRRSRKHRFSRRTTEAFHRCAQTVCYFFSALERSPLQARRRLWCRHCPSAHAAVAPGSPRVHRARWARKPKENTAWVRVPSLRRRTAPPPGCARAVSSGPPPPAPTPKRKRRRRVRHPARLRSRDAVSRWKRFDHPVSFPRLSAPPPARHGRTPRRYSSTAALRHSCPIRHRQVLLPGEGAGLPLARVVQARAAEPQV